jgi:hypothetical protein
MTGRKILIDTNVFIGLEDQKEIAPEFAKMVQLCGQHGVRVFVHEAAIDDIKRDQDVARRKISLSKVKKFEQLTGINQPPIEELVANFGPMPKPNDAVESRCCTRSTSALLISWLAKIREFTAEQGDPRHLWQIEY